MAPPRQQKNDEAKWYDGAYAGNEDISVKWELEFEGDTIKSGDRVKVKYQRGIFKFRCLAHSLKSDTTWFDCIDESTGEWRSFYVEKLKGPVKKRSRRGKKNV